MYALNVNLFLNWCRQGFCWRRSLSFLSFIAVSDEKHVLCMQQHLEVRSYYHKYEGQSVDPDGHWKSFHMGSALFWSHVLQCAT